MIYKSKELLSATFAGGHNHVGPEALRITSLSLHWNELALTVLIV